MHSAIMAGDRYFITNQNDTYFLTLTIVHWIDVFTRDVYRNIIVDGLNYCCKNKGLIIHAWVLMSNHLHLVCRCENNHDISVFLRDFKKHTSKLITTTISNHPESRREWLLDKFSFEAKRSGRAKNYKVWQDSNHAINLSEMNIAIIDKVQYVHHNPVANGLVLEEEHYPYSSARDYAGKSGYVHLEMI